MFRYLCAIGIWLAVPLVVFALPFGAPVATSLAMLYLYGGGPILALAFFILLFATRKKPQAATALILVLSLLLPIWHFGFTVGARIHLLVNEGRYAEKIRELSKAKSDEEREKICGRECFPVYDRSVVIFHFMQWSCASRNIVYDPHGAFREVAEDHRKYMFYLREYRHLNTFWYIGYFRG
jgi:hypothetical protein